MNFAQDKNPSIIHKDRTKISPMKAQIPIIWYDTIDSTNTEARRHISDIDRMSVYAAKFQTAGRGQRGNRWDSSAGQNLTFSILVNLEHKDMPHICAREQFLLSIISALTVSDFLRETGIENKIKWPNDIYVRDKKICGMLLENILSGDSVSKSIVGIGLNLNQTEFPPELVNPTSVLKITGTRQEPAMALERIVEIFNGHISRLAEKKDSLTAGFKERMYRLEVPGNYHDCIDGYDFTGKIKGISAEGLLLMEMPDNTVREYSFKEVSYII